MLSSDIEWQRLAKEQGTLEAFVQNEYLHVPAPVPLGLPSLDQILGGGLRPGVSVLGGEPGAGKSALGLQAALQHALNGERVLYASLEMGRGQCLMRAASYLSTMAGAPGAPFAWAQAWRLAEGAREREAQARVSGTLRDEMVAMATGGDPVMTAVKRLFEEVPGLIVLTEGKARTAQGLRGYAVRAVDAGASLIVVDYMQLVRPWEDRGTAPEYERVTAVSQALNEMGNDLGVPVLALSAMSRQAAQSEPGMHGFRGSGGVEYDANAAMVLRNDGASDGSGPRRVALHIVKNRWGPLTGNRAIPLLFDGAHNALREIG